MKERRFQMSSISDETGAVIRRIALPQAVLAILAVTSYHVQIITRISSGYPLWYWWLAWSLMVGEQKMPLYLIRWMIIYGIVQAALFASFLPPA